MNKFWLLLLFPLNLLAQTSHNKVAPGKAIPASQSYIFHSLTMDDFITTSADKGGSVVYNYDTTGLKIDGEIEINNEKKFISITYSSDKKHAMVAQLDGKPKFDKTLDYYTYMAHWSDSHEKTEISMSAGNNTDTIKVLFGPHKGDHAKYWDRIYKYKVAKKD